MTNVNITGFCLSWYLVCHGKLRKNRVSFISECTDTCNKPQNNSLLQRVFFNVRDIVCWFLARQPPPPQWAKASSFTRFLDHTLDTSQSVGLLWTSDSALAETSTWQHTTLTTDIRWD